MEKQLEVKKQINFYKVVDLITKNKVFYECLSVIIALLYPVINLIYNVKYQICCEEYYHVPGKYFHSSINIRLLYLAMIVILIIVFFSPVAIKKYYEKNGGIKAGEKIYISLLIIVIGMEIGSFNAYNLIEIMRQTDKVGGIFKIINEFLNKNAYLTIVVVTVLGTVSLIGITLLNEIENIKYIVIKNIINVVSKVALVVSIMFMLYGTLFRLSINIEDKTKYEVVMQNDKEYVILTECDDKLLVVPYKDTDTKYIFYTKQYFFIDKYEGVYQYINCMNGIDINSEHVYRD